jgi:hypothetical protein
MKAQLIAVSFGLALLAAIGYGAWLALDATVAVFASLDREVASITAIACIAALIASWVVSRGLGAATRQSRAMALRAEKTATYQLFVDFWESFLRRGRAPSDQLPIDLAGKLRVLERHLALYGAAPVIRAHTALRDLERRKGVKHPDLRERLGEALVAIRRDLGAETRLNAALELERLLVPAVESPSPAAMESRDAKLRSVLATS